MVKPAAKREAARHLKETYAVSLLRACGLMQIGTSSFYYKPKPLNDEGPAVGFEGGCEEAEAMGLPDADDEAET